jgi:hypothetical protein
MKKLLLAAILGGFVTFTWYGLSWMALPLHKATLHPLPGGDAVIAALNAEPPATGVYAFPMPDHNAPKAEQDAVAERWKKGAIIPFIVFQKEGRTMMDPSVFVRGLLLEILNALLAGLLLSQALPALTSYAQRLSFVVLCGMFAGTVTHLSYWNWMAFPLHYSLVMVLDVIIAWFLGGLVLAAIIKPKPR